MPPPQRWLLGKKLGRGGFNEVRSIKDHPTIVARRTLPGKHEALGELQKEAALMKLMDAVGVQPRVFAAHVQEEGQGRGSSSYVMQRGVELLDWLCEKKDLPGHGDTSEVAASPQERLRTQGADAAKTILGHLCAVSDLGLCLFDLKPTNAVMTPSGARLVDFDPRYTVFMDWRLLHTLQLLGTPPSEQAASYAEACARCRGISLYLMILQFYFTTEGNVGCPEGTPWSGTPRRAAFLDVFRDALVTSCIPLELVFFPVYVAGVRLKFAGESDLRDLLLNRAIRYNAFQLKLSSEHSPVIAMRHLVNAMATRGLISASCDSKSLHVRVMGTDYTHDGATCRASSARRHAVLDFFEGRHYPCPALSQQHPILTYRITGTRVRETRAETGESNWVKRSTLKNTTKLRWTPKWRPRAPPPPNEAANGGILSAGEGFFSAHSAIIAAH